MHNTVDTIYNSLAFCRGAYSDEAFANICDSANEMEYAFDSDEAIDLFVDCFHEYGVEGDRALSNDDCETVVDFLVDYCREGDEVDVWRFIYDKPYRREVAARLAQRSGDGFVELENGNLLVCDMASVTYLLTTP